MKEQEVKKIIDAMNQVKPVQLVPVFDGMTFNMLADYFGVSENTIRCTAHRNGEIGNNREYITSAELESAGYIVKTCDECRIVLIASKDGFSAKLNKQRGLILFNKRAIAAIAMRLTQSAVADRVRGIIAAESNKQMDNATNMLTQVPKDNSSIAEQVQVFSKEGFGNIRTIVRDGEPWFVAKDVCRALDITSASGAIARLDQDEKGVSTIDTLGGMQNLNIINEPGLYSFILCSRKSEAKAFKRWITHEVIPVIRKQGAYITPQTADEILMNPDFLIQLAERRKQEIAQMDELRTNLEQRTTEAAQYKDELQRINASVKELTAKNTALSEAVDRNKATTEELNRAVASLTAAKSENDSLTGKLAAIKQTKKKLEDKVNAYECRDMILALLRAYSYAACGGMKSEAEDDFRTELYARHGIDIELRMKYFGAGRNIIDYLRTDEYDKAANMMIGICKKRGINTDKILNVIRPGELFGERSA